MVDFLGQGWEDANERPVFDGEAYLADAQRVDFAALPVGLQRVFEGPKPTLVGMAWNAAAEVAVRRLTEAGRVEALAQLEAYHGEGVDYMRIRLRAMLTKGAEGRS